MVTGRESEYLSQAIANHKFSGGGPFSLRCDDWMTRAFEAQSFTVTSGTHALEMAALLAGLGPGEEVILPSFAFSSTATCFIRSGATAVFVDIEPETMNIDPALVASAFTPRTRAVIALHYAGVACDMDALNEIARHTGLCVIEDAAQAILSTYKGRFCGTLGTFGCLSFHETKNIHCGEGGAILLNRESDVARAEIIREKGTDRSRFFRGEIDKYTWRDIGSSYVLSELNAAFLLAQLEHSEEVTRGRLQAWHKYESALEPLEARGDLEIMRVPEDRRHNGHIFWIKTLDAQTQRMLLDWLHSKNIGALFHYVPLHDTDAGRRYGRFHGDDNYTTRESSRLIRLPLYYGFTGIERVVDAIDRFFRG